MKKLYLLCAILLMMVAAMPAHAVGISLDKVIINLKPGDRPIENINVTNGSDKTVKISVNTVEVINSGLPDQKEQPAEKLVAAPKSFEMAPGETRTVRLVLRGFPDEMESIYRVRFVPKDPTSTHAETTPDGKSVQVNIIVSMGALIMVSPKNPKPDLKFTRKGDIVSFTNTGNVTAQLQREDFCADDKKSCASLEGKRLFPRASWDMPLPEALKGKTVSQTVLINGAYSTLTYPAQ